MVVTEEVAMSPNMTPEVARRQVIDDARRTSELEGGRSTDATRADQDAYVRGEIDIHQLGERIHSRYGLA